MDFTKHLNSYLNACGEASKPSIEGDEDNNSQQYDATRCCRRTIVAELHQRNTSPATDTSLV